MKYHLVKVVSIFLLIIALVPSVSYAQGLKDALKKVQPIGQATGSEGDIANITGTIVNAALTLIGLIFLILMVYAGYLWMTARGDETQVEKAQEIVRGTVIGLVIVISAYAITVFITRKLGG